MRCLYIIAQDYRRRFFGNPLRRKGALGDHNYRSREEEGLGIAGINRPVYDHMLSA